MYLLAFIINNEPLQQFVSPREKGRWETFLSSSLLS